MKHKLKALMLAIFSVFFLFGVQAQLALYLIQLMPHSNLKIQTKLIKGLMLISSKKSLNARDGTMNKLILVSMLQ